MSTPKKDPQSMETTTLSLKYEASTQNQHHDPNVKTLNTQYLGTLDPEGLGLRRISGLAVVEVLRGRQVSLKRCGEAPAKGRVP